MFQNFKINIGKILGLLLDVFNKELIKVSLMGLIFFLTVRNPACRPKMNFSIIDLCVFTHFPMHGQHFNDSLWNSFFTSGTGLYSTSTLYTNPLAMSLNSPGAEGL